jgi:hypothetical protein
VLRSRPGSSVAAALLYDSLYRPLATLAYEDTESWEVPVDALLELGMVLLA